MEGSDRLKPVLSRCRWVGDKQGLLVRVPELNDQALPVESWPIGQMGEQLPLVVAKRLAGFQSGRANLPALANF